MSQLTLLELGAHARATFQATSEEVSPLPWISRLSWMTTSQNAKETYANLGSAPRMVQWASGPRQVEGYDERSMEVPNVEFQNAIEIHARDMRREKLGEFQRLIRGLTIANITHPNELIFTRLAEFETSITTYDGQYFWDTDHVDGQSGSQSNDLTFTCTDDAAPTIIETRDAIWTAVTTMRSLKNDKGRPFMYGGGGEFMILGPANYEKTLATALYADVIQGTGGAVDNSIRFIRNSSFELVVDSALDATWGGASKKFALFRLDGDGYPFIFQEEVPPMIDQVDGLNQGELFHRKRYLFGTQRSYNILGLHWHKSVLMTATT